MNCNIMDGVRESLRRRTQLEEQSRKWSIAVETILPRNLPKRVCWECTPSVSTNSHRRSTTTATGVFLFGETWLPLSESLGGDSRAVDRQTRDRGVMDGWRTDVGQADRRRAEQQQTDQRQKSNPCSASAEKINAPT
jgi:hypothetical protein